MDTTFQLWHTTPSLLCIRVSVGAGKSARAAASKFGQTTTPSRCSSGTRGDVEAGKLARAARSIATGSSIYRKETTYIGCVNLAELDTESEQKAVFVLSGDYKINILQSCSSARHRGGSIRQVCLIPRKGRGTIKGNEHVFFKARRLGHCTRNGEGRPLSSPDHIIAQGDLH
jgi:hypothetical protein